MTTAQPDPIAEDLRAIELASVATSIAKAAQPGQEQRMVTHEMCEAGREMEGAWGYSDGLLTNIYLAMHAARPTADLGDDGKLVERLRALAERQRNERGDYLDRGQPDVELEQAADRIELYREALEAIEAHDGVSYRFGDEIRAIARAVLSRSGG